MLHFLLATLTLEKITEAKTSLLALLRPLKDDLFKKTCILYFEMTVFCGWRAHHIRKLIYEDNQFFGDNHDYQHDFVAKLETNRTLWRAIYKGLQKIEGHEDYKRAMIVKLEAALTIAREELEQSILAGSLETSDRSCANNPCHDISNQERAKTTMVSCSDRASTQLTCIDCTSLRDQKVLEAARANAFKPRERCTAAEAGSASFPIVV